MLPTTGTTKGAKAKAEEDKKAKERAKAVTKEKDMAKPEVQPLDPDLNPQAPTIFVDPTKAEKDANFASPS